MKVRISFLFLLSHGAVSLAPKHSSSLKRTGRNPRLRLLHARSWRPYPDEDPQHNHDGSGGEGSPPALQRSPRASPERPTLTLAEAPGPPALPDRPKIVVLGASGRIGRRVVRRLLERPGLDGTVVACCRDYDKACRVLYDDLLVPASDPSRRRRRRGPALQIVQLDLVPPQELPGYSYDDEEEAGEAEWRRRASSAAAFYRTSASDYDDGRDPSRPPGVVDDEALRGAIEGCTAIISCVGAVRPTHLWSDVLSRPVVRLLRPDVSSWCKDPRHPYYVHYRSTRKVLACAEREQRRREAAAAAASADQEADRLGKRRRSHQHSSAGTEGGGEETEDEVPPIPSAVPRIRFVRISDLCVSQPPWALVPWVVNAFRSLVLRYQDMSERLLEASPLLETVVVRPGDLVDDARDESTTGVQVGIDGRVPGPSVVGRDDVAALAVAAALFDGPPERDPNEPFHYTLGVRWVGQDLDPYPPQGVAADGSPTAELALRSALRSIRKRDRLRRRRRRGRRPMSERDPPPPPPGSSPLALAVAPRPPRYHFSRPYGLCVAVPVYLVLAALAREALRAVLPHLPPAAQGFLRGAAAFGASCSAALAAGGRGVPLDISWPRLGFGGGIRKYISF